MQLKNKFIRSVLIFSIILSSFLNAEESKKSESEKRNESQLGMVASGYVCILVGLKYLYLVGYIEGQRNTMDKHVISPQFRSHFANYYNIASEEKTNNLLIFVGCTSIGTLLILLGAGSMSHELSQKEKVNNQSTIALEGKENK